MCVGDCITVEGGIEIFETFGLLGCEGSGVNEGECCETGIEKGEDFGS